ncbi:EI24 domain-containing protein [Sphingomonas sp. HF-S3]|uniref:EI24 domain-containing protein n=1 Tax=Sphingomonas rustica TaxID=3103142 RepID=A0ABV0BE83_9SPHN
MIHALVLSFGQLLDPRVVRVFLKSIALTLVLFAVLAAGLWWGLHAAAARWGSWLATSTVTAALADVLAVLLMVFAWWLAFRAIAIAVVGIFADEVVEAVEAKHYPDAHASARAVPLGRSIAMGARSVLRLIAVNLLLLPVYILLLVTGVGTAIAFFLVNSWLLGRDLGDMVAARHLSRDQLPAWRKRTGARRFALGAVGTGVMLVPLLNLIGPILGAAMATHAYHLGKNA